MISFFNLQGMISQDEGVVATEIIWRSFKTIKHVIPMEIHAFLTKPVNHTALRRIKSRN